MNVIKSIYMVFTILVCAVLLALFYGNDTTQAQPLPQETSTVSDMVESHTSVMNSSTVAEKQDSFKNGTLYSAFNKRKK